MSYPQQPPDRSQSRAAHARGSNSRVTLRLHDLAQQERNSVFYAPRGADWLWLTLFAAIMLGSGFYIWTQLGFDSEVGRAAFFAALLLSILWAALIYTFKLSASVAVGKGGVALARGPWRCELIWAEVSALADDTESVGRQRLHWLVVRAHDGRELRVREDMVADFPRLRAEVHERRRLWEEYGGTWGASGGGPFSAEEQVTNQVTWWLVGAGVLLLPGLYFAVVLPDTFLVGLVLVVLAVLAATTGFAVALGRRTYVVDQRAVTAIRQTGRRALAWNQITRVERARSRVRLLALVGIWMGRLLLAIGSRADSRIATFPWSPRVPEYLVLRAEGGRRMRVRLHRLVAPDELLAWIEFYDRVARHHEEATQAGHASKADSPEQMPQAAAGPAKEPDMSAATSATASAPAQSRPRVTQPVLGSSGGSGIESVTQVDPRILAVMRDVGDLGETGGGNGSTAANGEGSPERAEESSWLNESPDESLLLFGKRIGTSSTNRDGSGQENVRGGNGAFSPSRDAQQGRDQNSGTPPAQR